MENSINKFLAGISKAAENMAESIRVKKSINEALRVPSLAFCEERCCIDSAIRIAKQELEIEDYMSKSDAHRSSYIAAKAALESAINKDKEQSSNADKEKMNTIRHVFLKPSPHPDPRINSEITIAFQDLVLARDSYFSEISQIIKKNERLKPIVKESLKLLGYRECWRHIS